MSEPHPSVELVTIGTELLLGTTVDDNGAWLGRTLAETGVGVVRRATVPDHAGAIRSAVEAALRRTGTVICTGGLGPTPDDLTRTAVAELYDVPLILDESWLDVVRKRFRDRGLDMPESNCVQAQVPRGATLFANANGTAPGLAIDTPERGLTILLPGVPREMRALTTTHVVPFLLQRFRSLSNPIVSRVVRTTGISESALAERIDDLVESMSPITVAYLPAGTGEDVRLTIWGVLPRAEANLALDRAERALKERLGPLVYGIDEADLAGVVADRLRTLGLSLALAESCTGGLVAKRLTDAPGASDFFRAGFVTYSNEAKVALLGVAAEAIARHGAVSETVVRAMADGVCAAGSSDCGLAITGVAGPGGGSADKPVGTVWIAATVRGDTTARLLRLGGDRDEIRERAAQAALALLLRLLEEVRS